MALKQTLIQRGWTRLRPLRIQRHFTAAPAGSVLIEMGGTRVLCTASWQTGVPLWRKGAALGWLTAEYSMLPSATAPRKDRPRTGHTDSRGIEIQRLVGRVLRAVMDFSRLGENTICLDCDVLQADGGTRTAAINGSYVALVDALCYGLRQGLIAEDPLKAAVAAVSVGIVEGRYALDLDYERDSRAQVDLNVAMTDAGEYVELQGTAERATFSPRQLEAMLRLARRGIKEILAAQQRSLGCRTRK
jgi:ribonuclease PH